MKSEYESWKAEREGQRAYHPWLKVAVFVTAVFIGWGVVIVAVRAVL